MIRIPLMRFSLTYWVLDLEHHWVRLRNRRARLPAISTRGLAVSWAGSRDDSAVGQAMDLQTSDSRYDLDVGMTSTVSDGLEVAQPMAADGQSRLGAVIALVGLGLLLVGASDAPRPHGHLAAVVPLFMAGMALIFGPCAWRLTGTRSVAKRASMGIGRPRRRAARLLRASQPAHLRQLRRARPFRDPHAASRQPDVVSEQPSSSGQSILSRN